MQSMAGWNDRVDKELRRDLLTRRDEDQRVRQLVSPPKGQHMARLPDEVATHWQRVDDYNTRWLGEIVATRGGARPTTTWTRSGHSWMPCGAVAHGEASPVLQSRFVI